MKLTTKSTIEGTTNSIEEVIDFVKNQIKEKAWAIHIYRREDEGNTTYYVSTTEK